MPSLDSLLLLLAAIALTAIVAPRIRVPLPIALTGVGLGLALVPGLPHPRLDPDLVLLGFLPPLLYADAFHTSWVDFRRWLRPILMLAIGLVAVTIATVGLAAHVLFPALPWAACYTLGAVLSPTDTVATQAVLAHLRISLRCAHFFLIKIRNILYGGIRYSLAHNLVSFEDFSWSVKPKLTPILAPMPL